MAATKHGKQLARRRKIAERGRRRQELARRAALPRFAFEPGDAPPEFVALVREALDGFRLDDGGVFSPAQVAEFIGLRSLGLCPRPRTLFALGQAVLDRVPADRLAAHVPTSDVLFLAGGREIRVVFRSLRRRKGYGGTAFHSPHEPTIEVGGRRLVVAFSAHAIRRACDRASPAWRTYLGLGDAYALFHQCLEFEPVDLPGGGPAFTFYENCGSLVPGVPGGHKMFWSGELARGVLGRQYDGRTPWSYRVGYCPAVVENGLLKAKTLLYPGQRGTPEYDLILLAEPDPAERRRKLDEAWRQDAARLRETGDFSLLRWFHEAGVPQLVPRRVRYARPL